MPMTLKEALINWQATRLEVFLFPRPHAYECRCATCRDKDPRARDAVELGGIRHESSGAIGAKYESFSWCSTKHIETKGS